MLHYSLKQVDEAAADLLSLDRFGVIARGLEPLVSQVPGETLTARVPGWKTLCARMIRVICGFSNALLASARESPGDSIPGYALRHATTQLELLCLAYELNDPDITQAVAAGMEGPSDDAPPINCLILSAHTRCINTLFGPHSFARKDMPLLLSVYTVYHQAWNSKLFEEYHIAGPGKDAVKATTCPSLWKWMQRGESGPGVGALVKLLRDTFVPAPLAKGWQQELMWGGGCGGCGLLNSEAAATNALTVAWTLSCFNTVSLSFVLANGQPQELPLTIPYAESVPLSRRDFRGIVQVRPLVDSQFAQFLSPA